MSFEIRRVSSEPRRRFPWRRFALTTLALARPLTSWYLSWRKEHAKEVKAKQERTRLKRVFFVLLAVLCSLVVLAGTVRALVGLHFISLRSIAGMAGSPLKHDDNGNINVLLLGHGDPKHDGADLTDTMMVASIDPTDTRSVLLFSLPRDIYLLNTQNMGKGRINEFYRNYKQSLHQEDGLPLPEASVQAMKEFASEIGSLLNLPIQYVVNVNFSGFEDAVDAIGGVDVDVPYDINDQEYPDSAYGFDPFVIGAGPQHLDGATALKYARSRHTTSDFGRSARQQQMILALGEKVKAQGILSNPQKLIEMFGIFQENVLMTLTTRELISLAGIAANLDSSKVISMQINDQNGLFSTLAEPGGFLYAPPRDQFGGAAVLLPVSIPEFPVTWKQIQTFVHLLEANREVYLTRPTISVLNAGAKPGTARALANELLRYGFVVERAENAKIPKDLAKLQEQSMILAKDQTLDSSSANFFADTLKIPVTTSSTLPIPEEQVMQITIVLGKDYRYTPIQDLSPSL